MTEKSPRNESILTRDARRRKEEEKRRVRRKPDEGRAREGVYDEREKEGFSTKTRYNEVEREEEERGSRIRMRRGKNHNNESGAREQPEWMLKWC